VVKKKGREKVLIDFLRFGQGGWEDSSVLHFLKTRRKMFCRSSAAFTKGVGKGR